MAKSKGKERPHPSAVRPVAKAAGKRTSPKVASKAAEILRSESSTADEKSVAGSALAQLEVAVARAEERAAAASARAQVERDEAEDVAISAVAAYGEQLRIAAESIDVLTAENAALAAEITTLKAELAAQQQWAAALGRRR
jgi:hypothetical protein